MLKTRVITALALVFLLGAVLFFGSFEAFALLAAVFCASALWECFRLFGSRHPLVGAAIWTIAFGIVLFNQQQFAGSLLFVFCAAIWAVGFTPSLVIGLPPRQGMGNRLLNGLYAITILGCFMAIAVLFGHSPLYLFSVMAIVWIADIGAYFAGKKFGKRKLAPSISPGKSWEGAIGGWLAVLTLCAATTLHPVFSGTFAVGLMERAGWVAFVLALTILVAASIVGDLFESKLKRRAEVKDSSRLLPGHGGVLDRIDALIPAMPVAVLIDLWF